jgi:hypothetical protein
MLRLSQLLDVAPALLARLPFSSRLLRKADPAADQVEAPAAPLPPWPIRIRKIAADAATLAAAVGATAIIFGIVLGNPDRAVPTVVVNFADARGHIRPGAAQGETGAHQTQLKIDPDFTPFLEPGPYGPLPKISADGETPAKHFARPAVVTDQGSIVSVIVSGLGLDVDATRTAIRQLPPEITLSFSPYSRELGALTELARQNGHEYFIEVPLEPFDYPQSDPGPLVLLVDQPQSSNVDRLHRAMGEAVGYTGLLMTGRARFATSEAALLPIAKEAADRGLIILDDGRAPVSKTPRVTRQIGTLSGAVDRRLDDRPSADGMALSLIEFERLAVEQGRAIGAMDFYPVAIDRLIRWTDTLKAKGLVLEPVSVQILPPEPPPTTSATKSENKKSSNEPHAAERS